MNEPSAAWLLDTWEHVHGEGHQRSAVALLEAASSPDDSTSFVDLPIGDRDGRLMELRERLFGPALASALVCPSCGESMELSFALAAVRPPRGASTTPVQVSAGGRDLRFRLPTTRDLLAVADASDVEMARRELLRRCAIDVDADVLSSLADTDIDAIEVAMERADPQADVQLESMCTECGASITAPFDILAQLRVELDVWARRTLYEVSSLAAAFGWAERDILEMSAWRRQAYLRAAGA